MQYLVDDRKVYSNTVINRFQQFRRNDEDRRNSKQLHETLTAFMYMYRYIHSDCAQCFKSCFNSNQLMTIYLMTLAKTTLIWYVLVHRGITSLYGSLTILYCKMIREQSPVSILTTTSILIQIILQGSLRRKMSKSMVDIFLFTFGKIHSYMYSVNYWNSNQRQQ